LFLKDKSAAFDSIKYEHINLSLSRIGVLPKIIQTYTYLVYHCQSQVLTAYGPSKKFRTLKGEPQGWVESPFIWLICYDICLTSLRKENSQLSSKIYPMLHCPLLHAFMSSSIPVTITLTSFMDDLAFSFGAHVQLTLGLQTLQKFYNILGIKANPAKSFYIPFNSPCDNPLIITNKIVTTATKYEKQKLLRSLFNIGSGLKESTRHGLSNLTKNLKILNRKSINPFRLRYLLNSVIGPSMSYQFSICPMTQPFFRKMTTRICSTIKRNLRLSKEFPTSLLP
jgi:Reverse transcriptase (RNA-dependent DNA polymerase)